MLDGASQVLQEIAAVELPDAIKRQLRENPSRLNLVQVVDLLHTQTVESLFRSIDEAAKMAKAIRLLASYLGDEYCCAVADRAAAYVAYARADYIAAIGLYESAVRRFEMLGRDSEVARTLNSALQTLIYLNRFDQAAQWAARARGIFAKSGDRLRMARLDGNLGNLFYRQDRYVEARHFYKQAYGQFVTLGQSGDVAVALRNLAAVAISVGEFESALNQYQAARSWCAANNMAKLVAEVDYNIAYLHFLRGDYLKALDLYRKARAYSRRAGDAYHASLCDLDQAEVYLELNLLNEGLQLAERAASGFSRLQTNYEHAKALTLVAIAHSRRRQNHLALRLFAKSRRAIVSVSNPVWPAIIDLHRAACLYEMGRHKAALRINRQARRVFNAAQLQAKVAHCDLLAGRLYFKSGKLEQALVYVQRVLTSVDPENQPVVTFQTLVLQAQLEIGMGKLPEAEGTLKMAISNLETMRTRVVGDELTVAFIQDKAHIYALLIDLIQSLPDARPRAEEILNLMERSKSRILVEWMDRARNPQLGTEVEKLEGARRELNAQYRRIEKILTSPQRHNTRSVQILHERIRDTEVRFSRLLLEQQACSAGTTGTSEVLELREIQNVLPAGGLIVEYYVTCNAILAAVIGRQWTEVVRLDCLNRVKQSLNLLKFYFYKGRTEHDYGLGDAPQHYHLSQLYDHLVRPIRHLINPASHLVIIPHGPLHQLPYHALFDGSRFLIDDFTVSYAPSANAFCKSMQRSPNRKNRALVMGVPDQRAPYIEQEIHSVTRLLPQPIQCIGGSATQAVLKQFAAESRYIHIASHSRFRSDNALFSSIQLSDSQLSVFDVSHLQICADLVTLSGCSTGVSRVLEGDEPVGMARGFLLAGARAVMMTLWDVHDRSTAEFMSSFYSFLGAGSSTQHALRRAMIQLRGEYPAPYHWAPFVVTGGIGG